jgi:uncharacterized membrane protein
LGNDRALGTNRKSKIKNRKSKIMFAPSNHYIPQTGSDHRPLVVWLVAVTCAFLVIALILGAPLALANGHGVLGLIIYQAFSYLCHQIPERSLFIAGHPLAVCSRCSGIYAGFATTLLLYPLLRSLRQTETPQRKWLLIGALPLAVDFSLGFFGVWQNVHLSRFATGALLGAVAVFYVMPGLTDLSLRWRPLLKQTSQKSDLLHHSFQDR